MELVNCHRCGRYMGQNTVIMYIDPKPGDGLPPYPYPEPAHAHLDECPPALAEIEYTEGVSNYRVDVE